MRFTRLALITGLVLASTLLLAAPPASAHGIRFARAIGGGFCSDAGCFPSTAPPYDHVKGKVRAPNRRCRLRSFVILFRQTPGRDVNMGADGTGGTNSFRIDAPGGGNFPSGTYYLVLRRKVLRNNALHRHICPRLRTNTFSF